MIDVHAPHESVHSWRDFFIHLVTITIGLFIALSLEGCVEWMHHRHLVHEAEASLHVEVATNAKDISDAVTDLHKLEANLKNAVSVLDYYVRNKKWPDKSSMSLVFSMHSLDDVSWKTAQSTGALSYMPYAQAQEYADIYSQQDELHAAEQQGVRDAIISIAGVPQILEGDTTHTEGDLKLTTEQAVALKEKINVWQGQLLLVDAVMTDLDKSYKKFLAAHPS